jgi:Flp pilus assembly protein TadD
MAPVVQLALVFVLAFCWPGLAHGQSSKQSRVPSDAKAKHPQDLLAKQQQAISQGDPVAVAASSKALTDAGLEDLSKVQSELKGLTPSSQTAKQLALREKQLRQILGSAFNDWGTAEARQQKYSEALKRFREAEKWDALTPGLMKNLGTAAFRQEDYPESARALSAAVNVSPSDQNGRLMLAMSQFSLEQFVDAAKNFSLVNDVVLEDPRATYAWAYSLIRTNQPQQANALAGMLESRNLSPDVRMLVCKLYTASENFEQALRCLHGLASESPDAADVHYQTGATLIRMDKPADAITELRAALKADPTDADAEYDLAFALLETSQKEEGTSDLRRLIAVNPNYPQAQYQLGKVLLEGGQIVEAIPYLEAAAKLSPNDDFVHYQLQVAYRRSGRKKDADRELQRYKELKAGARDNATERLNRNAKP